MPFEEMENTLESLKMDKDDPLRKVYVIDENPLRHLFIKAFNCFMENKGIKISKLPLIGKKILDLFLLYKIVQMHGGFKMVCKNRKWSLVMRKMGLPTSITSAPHTLQKQYGKFLYAFESLHLPIFPKATADNYDYKLQTKYSRLGNCVLSEMKDNLIITSPTSTTWSSSTINNPKFTSNPSSRVCNQKIHENRTYYDKEGSSINVPGLLFCPYGTTQIQCNTSKSYPIDNNLPSQKKLCSMCEFNNGENLAHVDRLNSGDFDVMMHHDGIVYRGTLIAGVKIK